MLRATLPDGTVLSHETMGVLCLAVLWVVAVLVALAACQQIRELLTSSETRLRRLGARERRGAG